MNKEVEVKNDGRVLTKKDIWRAMRRHYLAISTYNYDSGFAATLVWELFPHLVKSITMIRTAYRLLLITNSNSIIAIPGCHRSLPELL